MKLFPRDASITAVVGFTPKGWPDTTLGVRGYLATWLVWLAWKIGRAGR
jgi:hypothetical protein